MTRRYGRASPTNGVLSVAGWLFAELAMVLVIIAVGAESPAAQVATPTVPTTPPTRPGSTEGLALTTVKFTMPVPASDPGVVSVFTDSLTRTVGPDAKVGLILLFGASNNPNVPVQGTRVSERVKGLITPAGIPQLRSTVDIRTYFGGDGRPGEVTVELFLLTGPS